MLLGCEMPQMSGWAEMCTPQASKQCDHIKTVGKSGNQQKEAI